MPFRKFCSGFFCLKKYLVEQVISTLEHLFIILTFLDIILVYLKAYNELSI
jgi:hypothetical protein